MNDVTLGDRSDFSETEESFLAKAPSIKALNVSKVTCGLTVPSVLLVLPGLLISGPPTCHKK